MKVLIPLIMAVVLVGFSSSRPVIAGILFHYNFESANLEDASGNGNLGELRGDPVQVEGKIGMALEFDGLDDHIFTAGEGNETGPLLFMHTPFSERTMAVWVKLEDVNGHYVIVDEGGTGNGFAIRVNAGKLQFNVRNANTEASVLADYGDTDWHHIAGVYKAGEIHLYVDGQQVASGVAPFNQIGNHGDDGAIGATFDGDACGSTGRGAVPWNFFQGIMDEIYYYDNALTAEEIRKLYQLSSAVEAGGKLSTTWAWIRARD